MPIIGEMAKLAVWPGPATRQGDDVDLALETFEPVVVEPNCEGTARQHRFAILLAATCPSLPAIDGDKLRSRS